MTAEELNKAVASLEEARGITHEEPTGIIKEWMDHHGIKQSRPDSQGKSLEGKSQAPNRGKFSGKEI